MVRPGMTGLLVPPEKSEELAGAIAWLLDHEEWAAELGRSGRMRAQYYDWPNISRRYTAIYREVLGPADNKRETLVT